MPTNQKIETHAFDAEVGKVLNLVIHSLYTNEDIFLRELISNASDACDKIRYIAISSPDVLKEDSHLKIKISADKDNGLLVIKDNGIGMNKEDLINNLGTIACSGTQKFLEAMKRDKDAASELIGQFGVGFYSAFMVAEEVTVKSRKFDAENSWVWKSNGDGQFTISEDPEFLSRGTEIVLKLKEDKKKYLDRFHIEHIVTMYSDHICFDIEWIEPEKEADKLNSSSALWCRNKNDITPEQYNEFFRSVAHIGGEPWLILHNKSEGVVQYTNLLFIPTTKPFDLFHPDRRCSVKLYVKKVFITEDNVQLIPQYMRFLKGVVDSEDLPLNISRETLQNNSVINKIRNSLVKRVLGELQKVADSDSEKYKTFWDSFGAVLKEGLCEGMDTESRERILSVCRFNTTLEDNKLVSLDDYISRMKENQKHIFFINSDSVVNAKTSPQIEGFISRGIEVLILCDPVDDFWVNVVQNYKNVDFMSVSSSDIDLNEIEKITDEQKSEEEEKCDEDTIKLFLEYIKEILGTSVADVRVSKKLCGSPVCLTTKEGAMNLRMERILKEQKQFAGMYGSSKIMEINLNHKIIKNLLSQYRESGKDAKISDVITILFAEACIVEGEEIVNKNEFIEKINSLLCNSL